MKRISLAVVASVALLAPSTLTPPANAAVTTYTTKSLTATISGSSVAARTTVERIRVLTYATDFGVCVEALPDRIWISGKSLPLSRRQAQATRLTRNYSLPEPIPTPPASTTVPGAP